jgi:glycosyltransferase involved in cell wall biosynthesis
VHDATGDRDGLPNVVLEALACGRPVVASDVGAIGSAIVDGRTGLLVPPGDPAALAGALASLARRPELGRLLGERGRQHVERNFDLARCTARLGDVLEAIYA